MPTKKDKNNTENLENLSQKSNLLVYGTDGTLDNEDKELNNIINQTIIGTKQKFGTKTNGKPITYFNEINIGNAFNELIGKPGKDKKSKDDNLLANEAKFKEYMTNQDTVSPISILQSDQGRLLDFSNYNIIYNHISECAQALDTYKDNIMSPDDFTKMIFDVSYDSDVSQEIKEKVKENLNALTSKYELEDKADKIIEESLKLGEYYVAVLSLEDQLNLMLNDPVMGNNRYTQGMNLSENANLFDIDATDNLILSENVEINDELVDSMSSLLEVSSDNKKASTKQKLQEEVARIINDNISIGSRADIILERVEADYDFKDKNFSLSDIPGATKNNKKSDIDLNKDKKPLYVNGSSIRLLDPAKVIELKVDNVCYGYYYVETDENMINSQYLGTSSGRELRPGTNLSANNTIRSGGSTIYKPGSAPAQNLGVNDQKLRLISDVFVNTLASKIDKNFIRHNKKFKDFIFELVKQDYIIKKGIKLTYFLPNEVIKFECPSIYRKIVFSAKLYLSVMTNDILIKLGRAHDKRIFYIDVGLDANYEQAINKVIDDIKRREYKMDNLNDMNTVLSLNPGRFDDYFMPTISGQRPIEIDTLAGMDADMNSDFLIYLKNSMMTGIGVPTNLIDSMNDISFARTLSAQNANFVRSVIRYQKKFTLPFTRLYQQLYKNEFKFTNDIENDSELNYA